MWLFGVSTSRSIFYLLWTLGDIVFWIKTSNVSYICNHLYLVKILHIYVGHTSENNLAHGFSWKKTTGYFYRLSWMFAFRMYQECIFMFLLYIADVVLSLDEFSRNVFCPYMYIVCILMYMYDDLTLTRLLKEYELNLFFDHLTAAWPHLCIVLFFFNGTHHFHRCLLVCCLVSRCLLILIALDNRADGMLSLSSNGTWASLRIYAQMWFFFSFVIPLMPFF